MGGRKRNPLLDIAKRLWLVRATTMDGFRAHFNAALEEAIINDELKRQEKWTAAVAIGSRGFVEAGIIPGIRVYVAASFLLGFL